jgi:hypothetical protein
MICPVWPIQREEMGYGCPRLVHVTGKLLCCRSLQGKPAAIIVKAEGYFHDT